MTNSDNEVDYDPDFEEDDGFRYYADEDEEYDSQVPSWYRTSRKRKYCSDKEDYD